MKKYDVSHVPAGAKDEPGKCPLCGMAPAPVGGSSALMYKNQDMAFGHSHHNQARDSFNKHEGHHTGDFLARFWISLVITIPILLLSHMIQQWLGFSLAFNGDKICAAGIGYSDL